MTSNKPTSVEHPELQALRTLALRLLAAPYPGAPAHRPAHLFVAQLPDTLPFELPIPDGATIIGSLQRAEPEIEIVLDTDLSAEQIRDFYRARMTAAGWSEPDLSGLGGGFVFGGEGSVLLFCRSRRGPALQVLVQSVPGAPNDLRLHLMADARSAPCGQRPDLASFEAILPRLLPPPGVHEYWGGGGGGGTESSAYMTAEIETDLDRAAIATHYAEQLEQAGWSRSGDGQCGPLAWSTWRFQDAEGQPWTGLFLVLQFPERRQRHFLQLHANWAANLGSSSGAGWASYGAW